jgi:hypothetical protein
MRVLVFAAALYLLAPGHPDVILAGVPLGQTGAFLLVTLFVAWAWTRDDAVTVAPSLIRALGIVIAVKFAIALVVPHSGWLAAYYANDQLTPPVRRSVDFSLPGATRIDRQVSFVDTEFPVHFFNESDFNRGFRREATEPFSVYWRGHIDAGAPLRLRYEATGAAELAVDGARIEGPPVTVAPGRHLIEVRYRKAKDLEGAIHVFPLDDAGQPRDWAIGEVTPTEVPAYSRSAARSLAAAAWLAHVMALIVMVRGIGPAVIAKFSRVKALPVLEAAHNFVMPAVVLGLTLQGLWKARHLVGHVLTLTGGDDWLGFEMEARDALLNGWMIQDGNPPGRGLAFFVYPGYSYFVAGAHWLTGESLAGVILVNFLVLGIATGLVYAIALRFTTRLGALIALSWLLALQQLDFVRYYTVTLLSENLFFLLVALCLYALVRFCRGPSIGWVVCGAVAGGLAAITRPTMMLFLPVAVIVTALVRLRERRFAEALAVPVLLVTCWMAAIAPITYRNWVMSGTPVLITDGQASTFIEYNLPTVDKATRVKYFEAFRGSMLSVVRVLLWILWEHPAETLRNWGIKAGFALGMVHWMGSGTPHPELLLTSLMYLTALLLLRTARSLPAFLIHGFVFTHLATLLLSMPSNYGYRLILPMYLVMVVFVGALVARAAERWAARGGRAVSSA